MATEKTFIPADPRTFALSWAHIAGALASHVVTAPDRARALEHARQLAEDLCTAIPPDAVEPALALAMPRLVIEQMNVGALEDVRKVLKWAGETAVSVLATVASTQPPPSPTAPPAP